MLDFSKCFAPRTTVGGDLSDPVLLRLSAEMAAFFALSDGAIGCGTVLINTRKQQPALEQVIGGSDGGKQNEMLRATLRRW
jgi:hypothetical protein